MKKTIFFLALTTLALWSCTGRNRFSIDTGKDRIEVKIKRFDSVMLAIDTAHARQGVTNLYKLYPEFTQAFANQILDTTARDTNEVVRLIKMYLSDSKYAPANKKAKELYANTDDLQRELSDAFTYIHHYFPQLKLPEIYFFVSGFNSTMLMNKNFLAIGTDMYLGTDFPLYKDLTYSYLIANMKRENIAADVTAIILQRSFMMPGTDGKLLDNMIYKGKILYLMSVFLPEKQPEIIMGYTKEQWDWTKKYEKDIWMRMIDNKDVFSTDLQLINKYMNEAPFTAPVSQESPGRLGSFIGWQIVDSYMSKNSNVSLEQLMKEQDSRKILEESGYHP